MRTAFQEAERGLYLGHEIEEILLNFAAWSKSLTHHEKNKLLDMTELRIRSIIFLENNPKP